MQILEGKPEINVLLVKGMLVYIGDLFHDLLQVDPLHIKVINL